MNRLNLNPGSDYSQLFYDTFKGGSYRSAEKILPLVWSLRGISSVVDIGCGVGSWLATSQSLGCANILGVDGEYVNKDQLLIDQENFMSYDLTSPLKLRQHYDLVICLEVAEHLPKGSSETFVRNLVSAGRFILFSAAVPGQGGTNHINEQFPEFWQKLFAKHGYHFYDLIRPKIFDQGEIELWYRQNIFVVCHEDLAVDLDLGVPGVSRASGELFKRFEFYRNCFEGRGGIRNGLAILKRTIVNRFF